MNATPATQWSTASFGDSADTRPGELNALHDHLRQCADGSRQARWRMVAAELHGHSSARFVTTLVLLGLAGAALGGLVVRLVG